MLQTNSTFEKSFTSLFHHMKMVRVSNFDINNEENNMRETNITSTDFLNL